MKNALITLGLLTLGWVMPAAAADMEPLNNSQLDRVVAGEFPDDLNAFQDGVIDAEVEANSYLTGDALNPVNFSAPYTDASNNAISEVRTLILEDEAQKDVKAVQLVNNIGGKVAVGSNVNVGGLDRSLGQSGTGSFPFLNQSNVIIQNR